MRKGQFDLNDLRDQLIGMQQMGGMSGLMGMLPGVAKMKNQLANANLDERLLKRQMAAIDSMTPDERKNPDILKASRKKRIASGAGVKVEDINRMLKMHRQMADMMKMMGSGKRGPMAGIANMLGLGGGAPMPTPEQMAEMAKKMPGGAARWIAADDAGSAAEISRLQVRCCPGSAAPSRASAGSRDWGRRNEPGRATPSSVVQGARHRRLPRTDARATIVSAWARRCTSALQAQRARTRFALDSSR